MTPLLLSLAICTFADDKIETAPFPKRSIDLTGYATTKAAVKADPKSFANTGEKALLGYLGVAIAEKSGKVIIDDVEASSAAEEAGLKSGDIFQKIGGEDVASASAARNMLRGRSAGTKLEIKIGRANEILTVEVTFRALSKPFAATDAQRVILGVQITPVSSGGIEITSVTSGGPADKAGLKKGDVILRVNNSSINNEDALREALLDKKAGDAVKIVGLRAKEELAVEANVALANPAGGRLTGWDDRLPTTFRKPVYRLAVIGVEYPDTKHSENISARNWEEQLFSKGTYNSKNASGANVYGSVADYYREVSSGQLKFEGKFFGWVEVSKKKMDYNLGSATKDADKAKFFNEMMDKALAKWGKDSLKDYDGIYVIFAGDRVSTSRGGLYWPHRASFTHDRKRWNYFIISELNRGSMTNISVQCHEFGHMLGLPDLYARPENPGSEGVGVWCAMSNQLPNGRPQHFSAWSKEQMGWIKPVIIDPRKPQKLILGPIEDSATECFKVLARADGSEYFLLENRQQKGFDKDLPAGGLLIWRVIPGGSRGTQQVFLEEAHGVEGPSGPRVYSGAVPFPSPANHSFTPFTTPSSKSKLGSGLDVNITNIRRLPDGRIIFHIGYEYQ